jgi:hypothetical protein
MSDEQITFPFLYFTIDNFDELFEGMVVTQGHDACVELVRPFPPSTSARAK